MLCIMHPSASPIDATRSPAHALDFAIAPTHPCLAGHFPGRPIVPGVVILDRVLDAIEARHGALGAVHLPQVKFAQPLLPGEQASIELEAGAHHDAAAPRWRFRVLRDGVVLASGEAVAA